MSTTTTPRNTRGRKGSTKDANVLSASDVANLLRESEERMKKIFKEEMSLIADKLTKIENSLSSVQTECARLDDEILKIKKVIKGQQIQIESGERKLRRNNIIVQNIPESNLSSSTEQLKDDFDKISYLCRCTDIDIHKDDFVSLRRLGRKSTDKARPLKIEFKNTDLKFRFLNKRKNIIQNREIKRYFHNTIYVNPDNSYLVQCEEFRLRQRLKELKEEDPSAFPYIRSGNLYSHDTVIDRIDVCNQLF